MTTINDAEKIIRVVEGGAPELSDIWRLCDAITALCNVAKEQAERIEALEKWAEKRGP